MIPNPEFCCFDPSKSCFFFFVYLMALILPNTRIRRREPRDKSTCCECAEALGQTNRFASTVSSLERQSVMAQGAKANFSIIFIMRFLDVFPEEADKGLTQELFADAFQQVESRQQKADRLTWAYPWPQPLACRPFPETDTPEPQQWQHPYRRLRSSGSP